MVWDEARSRCEQHDQPHQDDGHQQRAFPLAAEQLRQGQPDCEQPKTNPEHDCKQRLSRSHPKGNQSDNNQQDRDRTQQVLLDFSHAIRLSVFNL